MTRTAAQDLAVIRAALAGDRSAGEALAARLALVPRLLAAINSRRGRSLGPGDLEDLAQDVLVILWQKLDRFQGVGTLESWLHRFCVLEYRNRVRFLNRRSPPRGEIAEPGNTFTEENTVDVEAIETELTRLGPPEEEVVRMKHYDDLTFEEIGERLGVPASTAKARYYRGILRLRGRLAGMRKEVQ